MPKAVVIAIDWSDFAEKAFDWYLYHLHRKGTTVIIAHYIEAEKEKEFRRKEAAMVELQETYENRLLSLKIDYQWVSGSGGGPGEHILRTAETHRADMIVMGARGLGKIQKVMMGSVSDLVLKKSSVPVLICSENAYNAMLQDSERMNTQMLVAQSQNNEELRVSPFQGEAPSLGDEDKSSWFSPDFAAPMLSAGK